MLQGTDEQAIFNAFSGKLLFQGKEEFYEKCTSKRWNQARQSKFASGKPTGDGRNETGQAVSGMDRKGNAALQL